MPQSVGLVQMEKEELARHIPALRAYFRRRAPASDVDDLVQEVMVSMQTRVTLQPILHIDSYLFTIASHVLSKHMRASKRSSDALDTLATHELTTDEISPERLTLARIDLERAKKAILQLPERTRQVFVLHRFEHKTCPEIAAELAISVSAVEKHVMKAMRVLLVARGWRQ